MKIQLTLTFLLSFLVMSLFAQDIQGIATYKTQRKVNIELDSTQFNDEMMSRMKAMLKKQFEREYTLEFTNDESIYKIVESLDAPSNSVQGGGVNIVVAGSGNSDILYHNSAENRFANKNELFGKVFLIKDSIESKDWKLLKESKNIGVYTCFKATYETTRTVRSSVSSSSDEGSDTRDETTEEAVIVTAWYTPEIPVPHGPGDYGGLPGLILEATDGSETILCSKVVINPADGVVIEEPSGGKEVTQAEYDAIVEKKMEEMNERFESSGRRDDGNSFRIRIGG